MTTVSFQRPESLEQQLRRDLGDPDAAAKEAAIVELYRQGQLSHGKLAGGSGISRYETDAVLKRHNVIQELLTRAELDEQVSDLRRSLGQ